MSTAFASDQAHAMSSPPWDEMANGKGRLRPGWGTLLASLFGIGADEVARRAELLERMLTEDGVSGLLPGVAPVAWRCDPVPLLLGAAEFERLEAGLAQRASLIEAVLQDIYGPGRLLDEGLLPPSLVYANPAFLRPCCAPDPDRPGQRLHIYGAELQRGPDGAWHVVADRTADAAGIAYVLENRRALTRALPEVFRALPPRRLGPFVDLWQDTLLRLAPPGAERPGLALLTPGADDKLWFEHVVLARELSCTLVESSDLTVRDGALFLKTLQGLQRVHVLLRRQDGRTLDPLELEPMPRLGVTGLLDAARAGSVRVVNDPGTGCIEAPLWSAILPGLAQRLLGEELSLPSLETLWLADQGARERVLATLDHWRIRPALDGTGSALSTEPGRTLADRIEAAPGDYVASAALRPSLAPCFTAEGLEPRPVLLRMFMLYDGQRWRALPGGFARVLSARDQAAGRLPLHALCKDVWVASEEEEDIVGPAGQHSSVLAVRRASGDLPSRVAEHFFWLGRSLERLEGLARLLRTAIERMERPGPSPRENAELRAVLSCLALAGLLDRDAAAGGLGPGTLAQRLAQVARPPAELPGLLAEVSRLGELLRDRLTREVHSTLVQGLRNLGQAMAPLRVGESGGPRDLEHLCAVILGFAATMAGLAAENMVRSGGRLFLDLGRRVERAWWTARMVAQSLDQRVTPMQPAPLEPGLRLALELCDSMITYRNRYLTSMQAGPILDLVLADEGNPRALAFQLVAIRDILAELARAPGAELPLATSGLLRETRDIASAAALVSDREASTTLPARLRAVERSTSTLSDRIARQYFAILPAAHRLGDAEEVPELKGMA